MCGIWAVFGSDESVTVHSGAAHKIAHRGPDCFRIENFKSLQNCCMGFYRLAIVDDIKGMQPLRLFTHPYTWLIYNGEIYNHVRLSQQFGLDLSTEADGEPMIHLYQRVGAIQMARLLDGVFAFVILDMANRRVILGRDTYGVKPMFRFLTDDGFLAVCSEAKGLFGLSHSLSDEYVEMTQFPPGHVEIYDLDIRGRAALKKRARFNKPGEFPLYKTCITSYDQDIKTNIASLLEEAVEKRLMSDRRVGCFLSGGLDSSLVTALLVKLARKKEQRYKIQTFSIGMEGSTDLAAARKVADYLGTEHHEVTMTPEEGLSAIPEVIYHLESYDVGTIMASVGMYLLSKYIRENTDTVVVLTGEGSDELTQGYNYFHRSLSAGAETADKASRRLLNDLYFFDVLRVDRTSAAWGLEVRVPFLDHQFTSYYLSLDPKLRQPQMGVEKYLLRSSFDEAKLLPHEIVWRPKVTFSDGISGSMKQWSQVIQEYCHKYINQERLSEAIMLYPHNPPKTAEALYFRDIFEKHYPNRGHWIPHMWLSQWGSLDPGTPARALKPSTNFIRNEHDTRRCPDNFMVYDVAKALTTF